MSGRVNDDRTNGVHVETIDEPDLDMAAADDDLGGEVRPALTPAQLAFLALIAALIITLIRRLRGRRV